MVDDHVKYSEALENTLKEIYWMLETGDRHGADQAQKLIEAILGPDVKIPPKSEGDNARF